MSQGRRSANRVRQQILDGISDFQEWKAEMAAAAEHRRSEELRKRSQANCGTICRDMPDAWVTKMRDFFPAWSAQAVTQAEMLN